MRSTIGPHLFFDGDSLTDTNTGGLFGFGFGQGADLGGLLQRPLILRLAFVALHGNAQLGLGNLGLLEGPRFGFAQFALLDRRFLLPAVGFDLFQGNLTRTQLGQDILNMGISWRRLGRANQYFLQFQVVMLKFLLHLLAGDALDVVAFLDQLDQGARLADILEVGRNHRVQGLFHQPLDVTKALNH